MSIEEEEVEEEEASRCFGALCSAQYAQYYLVGQAWPEQALGAQPLNQVEGRVLWVFVV